MLLLNIGALFYVLKRLSSIFLCIVCCFCSIAKLNVERSVFYNIKFQFVYTIFDCASNLEVRWVFFFKIPIISPLNRLHNARYRTDLKEHRCLNAYVRGMWVRVFIWLFKCFQPSCVHPSDNSFTCWRWKCEMMILLLYSQLVIAFGVFTISNISKSNGNERKVINFIWYDTFGNWVRSISYFYIFINANYSLR